MGSGTAGHNYQFFLASLLFVSVLTTPQAGAKALYNAGSTRFVGVHYWFEDSRGQKFADPVAAGIQSKVALHLRSNVAAFLTVWMSDAAHDSVELTSRTSPGPEGKWTGQHVAAGEVFVASGFVVAGPGKDAQRIAIFLGRSQTEQVASFSGAVEKLARIVARKGDDGESVVVREVDRTTPGQIGTYVVNRTGGQTGGEIALQVK
jgi:hypothetical protein